ncbi:MAG: glycerol-3-phosphate cytidylyltransferase [Acutalibacter sp.]|nr:glycerol-3-phosphate cytidylyltransferase [Acutalibacter sp.]
MKRVITYGTFDLIHYGHINLLKRAKELGDYLIVALSTDEFNWNEKRKKCYFTYEERMRLLEAIRYVDLVIPEENWEQKASDVRLYQVDTFVMGDDWQGKFDFLKEYCQVVYLPRTPEISTTQIKTDFGYLKSEDSRK